MIATFFSEKYFLSYLFKEKKKIRTEEKEIHAMAQHICHRRRATKEVTNSKEDTKLQKKCTC